MASELEVTQILVSEVLSNILNSVSDAVACSEMRATEKFSESCNDDFDDVRATLYQILDKIDEKETSIGRNPAENISMKSLSKNFLLPPNLKSLSYLGISQTGRIMDPICLQQNM